MDGAPQRASRLCDDLCMPGSTRPRLRTYAVVAVSVGLATSAAVVLFVAPPAALQSLSLRIGLISAFLALPPAIDAMIKIGQRAFGSPKSPGIEDLRRAQEVLAGQVEKKWKRDHADRWLDKPKSMPVRWRSVQLGVIGSHLAHRRQQVTISGRSDQIESLVKKFRQQKLRRLVILGDQGSGKTTLAIQLLLELLKSPRPGEPTPVLVSLSGWDTRVHEWLHEWLSARLKEMYPVLREANFTSSLIQELIKRSMILPVLDGLDELTETARAEVILALNRSLTKDDQVIITSRTDEYRTATEQAGKLLNSAVAIESQPLDSIEITQYITECLNEVPEGSREYHAAGEAWQEVLAFLRNGTSSPSSLLRQLLSGFGFFEPSTLNPAPSHVRIQGHSWTWSDTEMKTQYENTCMNELSQP